MQTLNLHSFSWNRNGASPLVSKSQLFYISLWDFLPQSLLPMIVAFRVKPRIKPDIVILWWTSHYHDMSSLFQIRSNQDRAPPSRPNTVTSGVQKTKMAMDLMPDCQSTNQWVTSWWLKKYSNPRCCFSITSQWHQMAGEWNSVNLSRSCLHVMLEQSTRQVLEVSVTTTPGRTDKYPIRCPPNHACVILDTSGPHSFFRWPEIHWRLSNHTNLLLALWCEPNYICDQSRPLLSQIVLCHYEQITLPTVVEIKSMNPSKKPT